MTTISQLTLNRDWDDWIKACGGQMPHLHFYFYSFIYRIWALLATGATNFSNISVVSGNRPIRDLNLTHHAKAIKVLKALVNQITLHQSQGTPILVQATVATKYCPLAATYPLFPNPTTPAVNPPDNATRQDAKCTTVTLEGGNNKNANCRDFKHNPTTTPVGGNEKDASKLHNSKMRLVKLRGANKKDMGMFYLRNPESRATDIFPRDLTQKVCVDFTCKGRECTRKALLIHAPS
jgi:hypothetical protein